MEETIRMRILAYFVSLFYHLNKFKNGIMGLYTTQANYLCNKLRINFSMFSSLEVLQLPSCYYGLSNNKYLPKETGDDAILVSVVNNGQHNIMEQLSVYSV